jgi:hypothetical protein
LVRAYLQVQPFKILTILDTGTVKLKRYLEDGSLDNKILVSKFEVFTRKYKLTKTVRHLMDNWPAGDVGDQFSSELATAQALAQFLASKCDHSREAACRRLR